MWLAEQAVDGAMSDTCAPFPRFL